MSVPTCLFLQDLEALTEVFGQMSAGISGQKLPLWAEFLFLKPLPFFFSFSFALLKGLGQGGADRSHLSQPFPFLP